MKSPAAAELDLANVDLADPAVWDDGPPYKLFARMQREDPVHYSKQSNAPGEGGFWSITRFDDIRAVSRDHRTFSSEKRGIFNVDDIGVPLDVQRLQLISMDPPRHDRLKAIVIKAFTPERVAAHEEAIKRIINEVLDSVADRESFDLVRDVARPVPARVIGSMLGTPAADDERLVYWTNVFSAFDDPEIREQWDDAGAIVTEIIMYLGEQMAQRRENPGDDLITAVMNAEVDGEKLSELEMATFFALLMTAGNDSTRATYSATMLALMQNPDQLILLKENPELIDATVEEGLRYAPAFAFMGRAATKDVELGGKQIKEGDRLLLWYLASNRDETAFENPHEFDITREELADKHQAFGGRGKHFCLGANLARLELKLWIEETIRRFPDLTLDGEPTRVRALFLNQYKSILVRQTR
ncbi:cytochrome P450 [Mycobacterium sp. CBMA293]|uniref:cytochrome P450 n=2 Tax=Mycolicibacterium TaxID=1866885 RepID=UPI001320D68F|nr:MULTISPECIES: cytochrome P450 [unclassified Mycolicibacterium]MUL48490.1 cytochrome P450 [Mycolicibacterium sp. CBMA 360]MUL96391.1 cytochrome P450 [Mycolicibacterium sp. CBMA 230]MUL61947.1 cytochrome P450 [Mycolicibacterium sp. CBMA 335]MUL73222.1 cytochrome P450 [Mycolicibacterium sp. CBMA 311]MUM05287.1 cytochrome [Mycolicibacterium sp. CBMA 213]